MSNVLLEIDDSVENQYTRDFIRNNGVIKHSEDDSRVLVAAVTDCSDDIKSYLREFHLPKRVEFLKVNKADFASYIGGIIARDLRIDNREQRTGGLNLDLITKDAPIVNIINAVCIDAINRNASDIHIESMRDCMRIRYRIDGMLQTVKTMDTEVFQQIATRLKIMANLNIMEQRLPQDGRMTVSVGDNAIDLRISTMPITWGESIVLRIFNSSGRFLSLEKLGFQTTELERITECLRFPTGLVLATGPTGSGKTTTLHALLNVLNTDDRNIIAIEDPVEQVIEGINQIQIHDDIGLSFKDMLRRVLRQDPNIIMVGEIRDSETAELALRSSLTGHLILSTLHTNDSVSVVSRLRNMGLEPYLIGAVLRCSIAQRLVRRVCPECSREVAMPARIKKLCDARKIPAERMRMSTGCPSCSFTGYSGRTVIEEVFVVDQVMEKMISDGASDGDIAREAAKKMRSMAYNALTRVAMGITTFQEVAREVVIQ
jgi:general secretion pathway protein E/type IV pilus assembly protein PilB